MTLQPEENNNGTDNGRPTMMTSKRPATSKAPMTTTMAASKMPTTTPTTTSTTPARPTTVTAVTELLTSPASQGSKATSEEPVLQVTSTTQSKDDKLNET